MIWYEVCNILISSRSWVSSLVKDSSASAVGCWQCARQFPCFMCLVMLSLRLNVLWQSLQVYATSVLCTSRLCWSNFRRRVKCFLHGMHTSGLRGALSGVFFFLRVVNLVLFFLDNALFRLLSVWTSALWLFAVSVITPKTSSFGTMALNSLGFAITDCSVAAFWSSADVHINSSEKKTSNKRSNCNYLLLFVLYWRHWKWNNYIYFINHAVNHKR